MRSHLRAAEEAPAQPGAACECMAPLAAGVSLS